MIPAAALLLAGALFLAGSAFWVKAVRAHETIAEQWMRLADVQRHVDEAWEVIAEQPVPQQLYNQVEVEWLYETFALPAADIWEDGSCPRRRQDGER